MQARDVMTTDVITVAPETSVQEVARVLIDNRISGVPVVDGSNRIRGIVSESDLMRRPESETERHRSWWLSMLLLHEQKAADYVKTHGRTAADVMSRHVVTVHEDTTLEKVADVLQKHRIKRVPVVDGEKLIGIVSRADLLHGLIARQSGPVPTVDDRKIKSDLMDALDEAGVEGQFLNIIVSGGVVHVWGVVMTPEEKDAVRVATESVRGVKEARINVDAVPATAGQAMRAE